MKYWLVKSEPDEFSIDDLASQNEQTTHWDGVRNYQARNMMRDEMRCGDQVFFYHSNTSEPGIAGIAEVVRKAYADFTAFDQYDNHFDSKSDPDNPRWFMVDIKLVRKLKRVITLSELKNNPHLTELALVKRGNRLSVMPVSKDQWEIILDLE